MVLSLINIALFLLVVVFLLPLCVYSVYVHGFTKHLRCRGDWNERKSDTAV